MEGEDEGGDAAGAKEGDWSGKAEEGGWVGGTLDFSPRRHADLNGGLAPNDFASCARWDRRIWEEAEEAEGVEGMQVRRAPSGIWVMMLMIKMFVIVLPMFAWTLTKKIHIYQNK